MVCHQAHMFKYRGTIDIYILLIKKITLINQLKYKSLLYSFNQCVDLIHQNQLKIKLPIF